MSMERNITRLESGNLSLREALQLARDLGCVVEPVHRTGEMGISHPSVPKGVRVNNRRKDSPRPLITLLRQVAKRVQ